MDIDRTATLAAEARIEIAADPETVWDAIADLERWPQWNPDVRRIRVDGPAVPGTTFTWKAGPSTITSTLRSVRPPVEIGWTGRTLGIDAVHVWRFEGRDGRTVATTAESWAGLLPRLLRGPMRRQLEASLNGGLAHLKAEAERRAG